MGRKERNIRLWNFTRLEKLGSTRQQIGVVGAVLARLSGEDCSGEACSDTLVKYHERNKSETRS